MGIKCGIFILVITLFLVLPVSAETTGTINFTEVNKTVTGLVGNTIDYCNSNANCVDTVTFRCLLDYDGVSYNASYDGWCAIASQTSCAHNNAESASYENTTSGNKFCINNTAYRTCTNGNWSAVANCSSGETCTDGVCSAPSSSSSGGGGVVRSTDKFITITTYPSSIEMIQGQYSNNTFIVTNGNTTQRNITLSVSGIDSGWYSVSPKNFTVLTKANNGTFYVVLAIPENATIGTYTMTVMTITSTSVNDTVSVTLKISPSEKTVNEELLPTYESYDAIVKRLEENTTASNYSETKKNAIQNLIEQAKTKLTEAKGFLDSKEYLQANEKLNEISDIINQIYAKQAEEETVEIILGVEVDIGLITMLIIFVGLAGGAIAYIYWPHKESGYAQERGWLVKEKKKGIREKLRKMIGKAKSKRPGKSFFDDIRKPKPQ